MPVRPSPSLLSLQRGGRFRQGHPPQEQTFYGFRVHVRVCWPGIISRISIAPANAQELSVVPELAESTSGLLIGDRNYHSPKTKEELARMSVELLAPYSSKKRDPAPKKSAFLSRFRYRIETVFSQLTERYSLKRVRGGASSGTSGKQAAAQSPLSHRGFFTQPPDGPPTFTALQVAHLKNSHIGLARRTSPFVQTSLSPQL